eukprot:11774269-Heterocapsa_arctica.AAC.1
MYTKTYRLAGFLRYMTKNILPIKRSRPHEMGFRAYYINTPPRSSKLDTDGALRRYIPWASARTRWVGHRGIRQASSSTVPNRSFIV